jgi:hypothetical protein
VPHLPPQTNRNQFNFLWSAGFVDDCTGTYNNFQPQSEEPLSTMTTNMQEDAQTWNDLLWCSGGALELSKCSYHVLSFQFKPDGTPQPIRHLNNNHISLVDSATKRPILITPKSPDEPHKTLGHWKSPTERKSASQLRAISTKAKHTSTLIATGAFTRFGTTLAYFTVYIAALKYVLP